MGLGWGRALELARWADAGDHHSARPAAALAAPELGPGEPQVICASKRVRGCRGTVSHFTLSRCSRGRDASGARKLHVAADSDHARALPCHVSRPHAGAPPVGPAEAVHSAAPMRPRAYSAAPRAPAPPPSHAPPLCRMLLTASVVGLLCGCACRWGAGNSTAASSPGLSIPLEVTPEDQSAARHRTLEPAAPRDAGRTPRHPRTFRVVRSDGAGVGVSTGGTGRLEGGVRTAEVLEEGLLGAAFREHPPHPVHVAHWRRILPLRRHRP